MILALGRREGNLSDKGTIQMLLHFLARQAMTEEEHQLCNGTFRRTVIATDDTCIQQFLPGFVAMHLDTSRPALRDIYDNQTTLHGIFQHRQEPIVHGSIPASESFHYNTLEARNVQDAFDDRRGDSGEQFQDGDVAV